MNGFPQLLDETAKSLVQEIPPLRARFVLPYL
jgi:hypothetical protein